MSVMTRAQFRKQLEDGINSIFGLAYREYPPEWSKFMTVKTATKAVEEQVQEMGFGVAVVKPEGQGVEYDAGRELWFSRFEAQTIALAFAITEEAEEDGLYGSIAQKYGTELARAMKYTKEIKAAALLNNAFDSSYAGGDQKELCATDHPLGNGGTFSNELSPAADLSETALEALKIQLSSVVNERGLPREIRIKTMVVPKELEFVAERLLGGTERPGTSDRDINALYKRKTIPDWTINHYLTDPDAFFIITDCEGGLQHFRRKALTRGMEGDFETGNMRYKARERYVNGWHDPRACYASAGG